MTRSFKFNIHHLNDLTKLKKLILHYNSIVCYYHITTITQESEINRFAL